MSSDTPVIANRVVVNLKSKLMRVQCDVDQLNEACDLIESLQARVDNLEKGLIDLYLATMGTEVQEIKDARLVAIQAYGAEIVRKNNAELSTHKGGEG